MTDPHAAARKIDLTGPLAALAGVMGMALLFPALDAAGAVVAYPGQPWFAATVVVRDWQTLLGSIFTPLAAIVGAWAVLRQIQENTAQENARLRRRWRAQRAAMPSMMSRICDYAERSGALLREALALAGSDGVVVGARYIETYPQVDEVTFDRIVAMVEAARTEEEADAYHQLLHELQVHAARWRGFTGASGSGAERYFAHQIHEELVDAAEIYARASNLLVHARPSSQVPGPPMTRQSGVVHLGIRDDRHSVYELASMYDANNPLRYAEALSAEPMRRERRWKGFGRASSRRRSSASS